MTSAGSLLDRKLVFVAGKGGVGKSTVSTALALAAVRRGKRVLLVGLDFDDRRRTIAGLREPTGNEPIESIAGLFRQNVDGKAALEEYLLADHPGAEAVEDDLLELDLPVLRRGGARA